MEIIPIIEIRSGRSTRSTVTRMDQPYVLRDDVVAIAKRWKDEGAARVHIVDLDAARVGMPQNRDLIRDIIRRTGIQVQYSGGIRTGEVMQRVLNWGVERVVADADASVDVMIRDTIQQLGPRAILEIKVYNGHTPKPGAPPGAWMPALDCLTDLLLRQGWQHIIYRAILGDGSLGPADDNIVAGFKHAVRQRPLGVYSKISSHSDIQRIDGNGAAWVSIADPIYDGNMQLSDLLHNAVKPVTQYYQPSPLNGSKYPLPNYPGNGAQRPTAPPVPGQFGFKPSPNANTVNNRPVQGPPNRPPGYRAPIITTPIPKRDDHKK